MICRCDPRWRVHRLVRLADLPPAHGCGRVRPDRVQHHPLDPVGLDRRSPPAAVRARVAAALATAVGVDHHPRPARPAPQHSQARQQPLGLGLAPRETVRRSPAETARDPGRSPREPACCAAIEVDLTQVHPGAQHPGHTGERARSIPDRARNRLPLTRGTPRRVCRRHQERNRRQTPLQRGDPRLQPVQIGREGA